MGIRLAIVSILFVGCSSLNKQRAFDYIPPAGYSPTVEVNFVEESADKELPVGSKISGLTKKNFDGKVILQRLTKNTYWYQNGFYSTSFYVGKKSILLFDPLGYGKSDSLLKAIRSVSKKNISMIVYSHHHEDHIGGAKVFANEAMNKKHELKIVATKETARIMKENKSQLPVANVVINKQNPYFWFEGKRLKVVYFDLQAHSEDSVAWLFEKEKLIHAPDIVNANQLPFLNFGGSKTFVGYRESLFKLKSENWSYFSSGHGNVGSKLDIEFMIKYVDDMVLAIKNSQLKLKFSDYFVEKYNNHQAAVLAYKNAINSDVMRQLRVKYGKNYGFEASVPIQIEMVIKSLH